MEVRPAAVKPLRRIDPQDRGRVHGAIALLGEDPRPPGARALQGRDGYRVRVGDYRIIYTIRNDILVVVVVTVGRRRDVYEQRVVQLGIAKVTPTNPAP
ncbi:type II toxin-antitoxin system RelE/ParE family toxin [Cryobacterium sp. PH31-AA6]|nr:type II toxin-antitoxin system RelE/ParE family toxin [Cryobacterium sp. PH31-AA6]MDJ0322363.1 type II toxin-antitoxin system RelE/ParE family toxin [Cryobacterium sp. PH31-AA6]